MNPYLIAYDLNAPGKNYSALYEKIKQLGKWWHYLDSTWIVSTDTKSSKIANDLKSVLDSNDTILVIEVKDNCDGWLPEDAWNWIKQNIPILQ